MLTVNSNVLDFHSSEKNGFHQMNEYDAKLEYPDECPHCGKSMYPNLLTALSIHGLENYDIASIFICNSCGRFIFTLSYRIGTKNEYLISKIFPTPTKIKRFSEFLEILSPTFIKVYEQAAKAECNGFDELCGMGYRKALEFLMKDYAIYRNPDKEEDIINCPLSKCINTYCNNDRIKTLATACAWIGNDFTHYSRKNEEYGINELKTFISAVVTFIDSELAFDSAAQLISP